MKFTLSKMNVRPGKKVQYTLKDGDQELLMNDLIGHDLKLEHTGRKSCSVCGTEVKKFYGQGFCYPCFANAPENSECIIRPELCRGHIGEGRDPDWEEKNHVQAHVVYLALTSAVKVGVTRKTNVINRWIDQGAWKAVEMAEVPNRYLAGKLEVALKGKMGDKTNWRKMLKNEMQVDFDLFAFKEEVLNDVDAEYLPYITQDAKVLEIDYPVQTYPTKVASLNFDKMPVIEGKLIGIRGQYLIFDGGQVINIRKFTGYEVELTWKKSDKPEVEQMSLF